MKLINTALLTPRNILVISLFAIAVHVIARPVYNMIDGNSAATGA